MKRIILPQKKLDYKKYVRRRAKVKDASVVIDKPFKMYDLKGDLKIVYLKLPDYNQKLVKALQNIKYQKNTRVAGTKTLSKIFGWFPRIAIRNDYCQSTAMAKDQPVEHALICEYAKTLNKVYKEHHPFRHRRHLATTLDKLKNGYYLEGTCFTSGIVNKNNPLNYHFDTGNFKGVWSAMIAYRKDCIGGHLICPQYDLQIKIRNNHLLLFDGQGIMHGVTPFKLATKKAYRYTIVYYSLEQLWKCEPLVDEVARIRNKRFQREQKRYQTIKNAN